MKKNNIIIVSIICATAIVLASVGAYIYINEKKIQLDRESIEKQLEQQKEKDKADNKAKELENAQREYDTCVSANNNTYFRTPSVYGYGCSTSLNDRKQEIENKYK